MYLLEKLTFFPICVTITLTENKITIHYLPRKETISQRIHTFLVIAMVLIILFLGLRPKSPLTGNDAQWLSDEHALIFQEAGIAYIDDLKWSHSSNNFDEFTIELRVAAQNIEKSGIRPILMINNGSDRDQLIIWQWGASIIAMNGDDYDYTRKLPRVSSKEVLAPGKILDISIISSNHSTKLYINGQLAVNNQTWQISIPGNDRKTHLILGNSIYAKHGWGGAIYSLAIHAKALSSEELHLSHRWKLPEIALYTIRPDEAKLWDTLTELNYIPLLIPKRIVMLKKSFMTIPWHSFSLSRSFLVDGLLNFFGFVPLGLLLCYRLWQSFADSKRSPHAITFLSCFLISLTIETCQVWQPARTSSVLDLLLNSLGSYLGILLASTYFKNKKDS